MIHYIFKNEISFPEDGKLEQDVFGMGCFWGAEKKFWELEGVKLTAVGYAGGDSKNPSYRDVCTGLTGHNEVVKVLFDPMEVSYLNILAIFWNTLAIFGNILTIFGNILGPCLAIWALSSNLGLV